MTDQPDPTLSVIIPAYRSLHTLGMVLTALPDQLGSLDTEVIVVESSGPDVATRLVREYPWIRLVASDTRLSPGAARNLGASRARGKMLVFLDADCIPEMDWGQALEAALERSMPIQSGAIVNGTPDNWPGTLQFWSEFAEFTPQARAGYRKFVPSFQLLVDRDFYDRSGGFPTEFIKGQDLVFAHHLLTNGTRAFFDPRLRVRHINQTGWRTVIRHVFQLGRWSGMARQRFVTMSGGWLRWIPIILPALVPYRWWKIRGPLLGTDDLPLFDKIRIATLLWPMLTCWMAGFSTGLLVSRPPIVKDS